MTTRAPLTLGTCRSRLDELSDVQMNIEYERDRAREKAAHEEALRLSVIRNQEAREAQMLDVLLADARKKRHKAQEVEMQQRREEEKKRLEMREKCEARKAIDEELYDLENEAEIARQKRLENTDWENVVREADQRKEAARVAHAKDSPRGKKKRAKRTKSVKMSADSPTKSSSKASSLRDKMRSIERSHTPLTRVMAHRQASQHEMRDLSKEIEMLPMFATSYASVEALREQEKTIQAIEQQANNEAKTEAEMEMENSMNENTDDKWWEKLKYDDPHGYSKIGESPTVMSSPRSVATSQSSTEAESESESDSGKSDDDQGLAIYRTTQAALGIAGVSKKVAYKQHAERERKREQENNALVNQALKKLRRGKVVSTGEDSGPTSPTNKLEGDDSFVPVFRRRQSRAGLNRAASIRMTTRRSPKGTPTETLGRNRGMSFANFASFRKKPENKSQLNLSEMQYELEMLEKQAPLDAAKNAILTGKGRPPSVERAVLAKPEHEITPFTAKMNRISAQLIRERQAKAEAEEASELAKRTLVLSPTAQRLPPLLFTMKAQEHEPNSPSRRKISELEHKDELPSLLVNTHELSASTSTRRTSNEGSVGSAATSPKAKKWDLVRRRRSSTLSLGLALKSPSRRTSSGETMLSPKVASPFAGRRRSSTMLTPKGRGRSLTVSLPEEEQWVDMASPLVLEATIQLQSIFRRWKAEAKLRRLRLVKKQKVFTAVQETCIQALQSMLAESREDISRRRSVFNMDHVDTTMKGGVANK